jgi:uncharacterized membrane protein (DUF485 family)
MSQTAHFLYEPYIKKSETKSFLVRQRKLFSFILLTIPAVLLVMRERFFLVLVDAYQQLGMKIPTISLLYPKITALSLLVCGVIAIYLLMTEPNFDALSKRIKKAGKAKFIDVNVVSDKTIQLFSILIMAVFFVYMYLALFDPMYDLMNSFK